MKRSYSHSAQFATLLGLAALLAISSTGCQCCRWTERYQDCVDRVCDHEGHAQVFYRPWYDLTRIGRVDWPWWFPRRRPAPGFVYHTPVTNEVMSRMQWQQDGFAPPSTMAPPPLLTEDLWSTPDSSMNSDDVGVAPVGPLFESQVVPPPAPAPVAPDTFPPEPPQNVEPQLPPMESSGVQGREPTPAVPRLPTSSQIDSDSHRADDWMQDSGVVSLFDDEDVEAPTSGITIHQYDRGAFEPISMESWLSDELATTELPETAAIDESSGPTTAATRDTTPTWATQHLGENTVRTSEIHATSGTQDRDDTHREQRAQWWEAQPVPATRTADDVFGPTPFAEWQSATE